MSRSIPAHFTQPRFRYTGLDVLVTDGASMAMEIIMLGVCGGAGEEERPLLMFNPSYTNYDAVWSSHWP